VDGSGVGDVGPRVLREREALARDGFVIVHLTLDSERGRLLEQPQILTKGFVFVRQSEGLIIEAQSLVSNLVRQGLDGNLESRVEEELSKFFYNQTRRRPMIFVFASRTR